MASEQLTINITDNGSGRTVVRSINSIGQAADNATRGLYLFNRAVYTLGLAGGVVALVRMVDGLTQMQNRLKLTAGSLGAARDVMQQLFDVAQRSRTSFDTTAEIYNRMALSARALVSQQRFSRSLFQEP